MFQKKFSRTKRTRKTRKCGGKAVVQEVFFIMKVSYEIDMYDCIVSVQGKSREEMR